MRQEWSTTMTNDVGCIEGVGAVIITDISTIVARRLQDFIHFRNELMLSDRPDDYETRRLLRQLLLHNLDKGWKATLQTLRTEIPKTLDQLFNSLQPEFQDAAGLPAHLLEPTSTPQPVSTETQSATDHISKPTATKAVDLSMTTSSTGNRARSVTLAPDTTVFEFEEPSIDIENEPPAFNSAATPTNKRSLDIEESAITSISKKAKKTPQIHTRTPGFRLPIKRSMYLRDVKEGECIFMADDYFGVYVLRCNLVKCKKKLKQDGPIIFTSHPFRDGLAFSHFDGECHSIDSEEEIFRRFAIRITDANTERNTEKRGDSVFDSSCSEVDLTSPPVSPRKSRDKGKKPERPYNMHSPKKPEASTSQSASRMTETFRESFYRAGPLPSVPDSTRPGDNEVGLPPRANTREQDAD